MRLLSDCLATRKKGLIGELKAISKFKSTKRNSKMSDIKTPMNGAKSNRSARLRDIIRNIYLKLLIIMKLGRSKRVLHRLKRIVLRRPRIQQLL